MNLHEYLFYNGLTAHKFAELCDLSGSYICSILRGDTKPSAKTLRIIKRVTGGKVTASSALRPIQFPDDEAA